MYTIRLINGLVYIDGAFAPRHIYIQNKKIAAISQDKFPARMTYDCTNQLVLPGIIDPHVHFALDLGSIVAIDDFASGSLSAAYGGVTTFFDFLDPARNAEQLRQNYERRIKKAQHSILDYRFHATIANPDGSLEEFVTQMKEYNIHTVKLFTTYSNSNRRTSDDDIIRLLQLSQRHQFLILAHIENDEAIDLNPKLHPHDLPLSRPSASETNEALKLAHFTRVYGGKLYMVHLSSGETLRQLRMQFGDILGKQFFVESCPHYFTFSNDVYLRDDGYLYTMVPPLRSQAEVELLYQLIDYVNTIGTDHCSFLRRDKNRPYLKDIPLGIGSIEHSFDVMYHHFKNKIIDKMTINVARIFGLEDRKGSIAVGKDADLMVYEVKKTEMKFHHSKSDYDIYNKMPVSGRVVSTMSQGKWIIKNQIKVSE